MTVTCTIPIRLPSAANLRDAHWANRHRRVKRQREVTSFYAVCWGLYQVFPQRVTLTRRYAGQCRAFDGDNLVAAFKTVRDALAAVWRINDADERVTWNYAQEPADEDAVVVTVETLEKKILETP